MDKTFPEAISGIRSAVMASEVREDIAQGMEYVEQFASTATTKAAEAAASAKTAADAASNASTAVSAVIDPTLSLSGKAADAKATGDAVRGVRDDLAAETERAKGVENQIKEESALQKAMVYADEYVTTEHLFIKQKAISPTISVGALLRDGTVDTSNTGYSIAMFTAQRGKVYKVTNLSPGANYRGKRLIDLENRGYYEATDNFIHTRYISNFEGTVHLCYRNIETPIIDEGITFNPVKETDIPFETFFEEVNWQAENTIREHYAITPSGVVIKRASNSMAYSSPISVKAGWVIVAPTTTATYYDIVLAAKVITEDTLYNPFAYKETATGKYIVVDEDCNIALCAYKSDLLKMRILKNNIASALSDSENRKLNKVYNQLYFAAEYNGNATQNIVPTITPTKQVNAVTGSVEDNINYDIATFVSDQKNAYSITYVPGASHISTMGISLISGENVICYRTGASATRETVYIEGFTGTVRICYRNIETPTIKGGEMSTLTGGSNHQFINTPTRGQIIYEADTKSDSGYIVNAVAYQNGVIIAARTDGRIVRIGYDETEETLLQLNGSGLDWRGLYMDSNENVYASPHASNGTLAMDERGLYRLSKDASSFTKVISLYNPSSTVQSETEKNDDTIWTMCEDVYGNLYAGIYSHAVHQNPAIYKSTDNGLTWKYIYNFYTAGDTPGNNARHIHSIVYSKWQDALYCIVGEVNTIFKSTDGGTSWENLNIRLDHDKGSAMLPVENGILIGSDGAYNCAIDILYNDDYTHETVWLGWANTVFAIRQSDETGMIYAFCKIDSSANSSNYFPPSSVLSLSSDAQITAINEWKSSVSEGRAASWQAYHDSIVAKYPDDAIIPQHYAILVSRDGGRHFEPLKRWKVEKIQPYGFWTIGHFRNGECIAGRYVNGYVKPIAISEGKHKYVSGGCDLSGDIFIRTNANPIVKVIE